MTYILQIGRSEVAHVYSKRKYFVSTLLSKLRIDEKAVLFP